jgi:CheY-like chemotaxis protein
MVNARHRQQTTVNERVVLIADPDSDARGLYRASLGQRGWVVEEAGDGTEALAKAFSRRPKVIVTEARLATIDGYTLCELLRRDLETRSVPVLFLTAATYPAQFDRARLAGADAVLAKPCLPERLLREMDWLIEHIGELQARRTARTQQAPRLPEVLDRSTGTRATQVRARQRFVTTAPTLAPPVLFCPSCERQLAYDRSHLGGVSDRFPEQWDYYVCVNCGTFQYRQRTRKLRHVP